VYNGILPVIAVAAGIIGSAILLLYLSPNKAPLSGDDGGSGGIGETLHAKGHVAVSVVRNGSEIYHYEDHNLITNAGKDFITAQIGSTSADSNGANYVALSSDSTAPEATDTTLTGEVSGSGLEREQGTYSHTGGTNTFTIQKTFTASGIVDSVQKTGLFTASSSGTMMAENTFTSVNILSGDQLTVTWTITIG
jgi:hypothetical protein